MSGMGGGGGGEEAAGRAAAAAAAAGKEKSSFAVTCSLLSQYLKERKGGLRGLALDAVAPPPAAAGGGVSSPPTTMNLLSALDATPAAEQPAAGPRASGSVELPLENTSSADPPLKVNSADKQNNEDTREAAGEQARQLTIFYGGKVLVFDNFPSTKVKDLLQMVNAGDGRDMAGGSAPQQGVPRPAQNNLSDLPIARRNSLHRFLEKRKGRIIAKAPYQVHGSVDASRKDTGDKSWLGLGQEVTIKQEI